MIENNLAFLHLTHLLAQHADRVFTDLAGEGAVTARQLAVLAAIAAQEGASQTDIVGQTGVDRSTMADIVRRLHKHKLIVRKRSKVDGRAYQLTLTEAGRGALKSASSAAHRAEVELLAQLTSRERFELIRLMKALAQKSVD